MAKKPHFGRNLVPLGLNSGANFFSRIWLRQSLDIMISYHHVQYQKRRTIQSREHLVTDGRTDRRTDRQTDRKTGESYFIGRYPTYVERPTKFLAIINENQIDVLGRDNT